MRASEMYPGGTATYPSVFIALVVKSTLVTGSIHRHVQHTRVCMLRLPAYLDYALHGKESGKVREEVS